MAADAAARAILQAAADRTREVVMTAKGRAGVWLRMIAPDFIDRQALKAIRAGR
jgi:hypothetical protein